MGLGGRVKLWIASKFLAVYLMKVDHRLALAPLIALNLILSALREGVGVRGRYFGNFRTRMGDTAFVAVDLGERLDGDPTAWKQAIARLRQRIRLCRCRPKPLVPSRQDTSRRDGIW